MTKVGHFRCFERSSSVAVPLKLNSSAAQTQWQRRSSFLGGLGRVELLGLLQRGEEDAAAQADPDHTRLPALKARGRARRISGLLCMFINQQRTAELLTQAK